MALGTHSSEKNTNKLFHHKIQRSNYFAWSYHTWNAHSYRHSVNDQSLQCFTSLLSVTFCFCKLVSHWHFISIWISLKQEISLKKRFKIIKRNACVQKNFALDSRKKVRCNRMPLPWKTIKISKLVDLH